MRHFDSRLACKVTGRLEATEDSFLTREYADHVKATRLSAPAYVVVACDEAPNSRAHDVDLAYHAHVTECLGETRTFERWVGEPTHLGPDPYNGSFLS